MAAAQGLEAFVSQSHPGGSDHHGALDPLLAFNAEFASAQSPQKPADPTLPAAPQPVRVAPGRGVLKALAALLIR
jgi:hypothetical protein